MSEDSQKSFQKVMDKLFYAPKSKPPPPSSPSSSTGLSSRGKKQLKWTPVSKTDQSLRHNLMEKNSIKRSLAPLGSQAPVCRPWDRGDLMRRLSTFKSMTWFAKPKVVSPVNCARRGWVNVDMDTISCEACGACLLFSTPSSWTQQQVEKAAAVFSLKLDSGHKLLCPWIDNACDETLALFPPTPAPALVEGYKERSSALIRVSALPVISPAAMDYMWSPKLQWLLEQYFHSLCALGSAVVLADSSKNEGLVKGAASQDLYYQAQKLISLCGWEPHLLPYSVDCKNHSEPATEEKISSSDIIKKQEHEVIVGSSDNSNDVSKPKDENSAPHECETDPASVVLDCRFCGARVGLWAFSTVQRPLELVRLVETTQVSFQADSNNGEELVKSHPTGALRTEMSSGLNMTIAGGLPPTKQNLKATVSLPIISRHLRTDLNSTANMGKKRKRTGDGEPEEIDGVPKDENSIVEKEGYFSNSDSLHETPNEKETSTAQDMGGGNFLQDAETAAICREEDHTTPIREVAADAIETCRKGENDRSPEHIEANLSHDSEPTGLVVDALLDNACDREVREGDGVSDNDNRDLQVNDQTVGRVDNMMQMSINNEFTADHPPVDEPVEQSQAVNVKKPLPVYKRRKEVSTQTLSPDHDFNSSQDLGGHDLHLPIALKKNVKKERDLEIVQGIMHFDPIKQHRYFCPWIASTDKSHLPGWQVTLSALFQEESPDTPLKEPRSNSSIIKVDDPITSIRHLFMSPAEKKRKSFYGSR